MIADDKITAVCLLGPTASGKTGLAVELARQGPFEVISVDSALVYRGMDIGTAKPEPELLAEIPHHLVDIRDPSEPYSAADFRNDAIDCIRDISARGKIPLLTGGTMMYFKALKEGLSLLPAADPAVRERLAAKAEDEGWGAMHQRLEQVDPVAAARIHENDPQRLQRALEVYEISGRTLTSFQETAGEACPFKLLEIAVIPPDRSKLHGAIAKRFEQMIEAGFVAEVAALYHRGDLNPALPSIKAVGYRQAWSYLDGEISHDVMVEKAIIATRQFAKRQYTWLRSWKDLHQIEAPNCAEALKIIEVDSILA